jgi:hypothetical protein
VKAFQAAGGPAISVDTKKKERVGDFKNSSREQRPKGQPAPVRVNAEWVNLGISYDTAVFSVESIRHWWYELRTWCRPPSHRDAAADHPGLRRQRRRAAAPMEAGTASSGRRTRNIDHRLPSPTWHQLQLGNTIGFQKKIVSHGTRSAFSA